MTVSFKTLIIFFLVNNYLYANPLQNFKNIFPIIIDEKNKMNNNNHFIAHATGEIENIKYLNSLESLKKSISDGYKFIEIDLLETSDSRLVAAHNWKNFKKISKSRIINDEPMNSKDFLESKILNKYTPLSWKNINNIFKKHSDIYLFTDKTNNFNLIKKSFSFQDRIIVEVFGHENYFKSIKEGIEMPMYSIYLPEFKEEINFIKRNNVNLVAIPSRGLDENFSELVKLRKKGVLIFSFTSNNFEFINKHLGRSVDAFYTDKWKKNFIKNNLISIKEFY